MYDCICMYVMYASCVCICVRITYALHMALPMVYANVGDVNVFPKFLPFLLRTISKRCMLTLITYYAIDVRRVFGSIFGRR